MTIVILTSIQSRLLRIFSNLVNFLKYVFEIRFLYLFSHLAQEDTSTYWRAIPPAHEEIKTKEINLNEIVWD